MLLRLAAVAFLLCPPVDAAAGTRTKAKGRISTQLPKQRRGEYDVFLVIGQSNMAGRGEMLSVDRGVIEGVWILDSADRIVPADAPLNRWSTVRKSRKMQGLNPAYAFSRKVAKTTGRRILLVMNARGATTLGQWMKDAPEYFYRTAAGDDPEKDGLPIPSLYGEAVRRGLEGMKHGTLRAILWHQGEGNSSQSNAPHYLKQLSQFVSQLRGDLGVGEEVPFIAGEICYDYENAVYFNPEIMRIGEAVKNGHAVSAEGCASRPDNVHFSREGQLLLGERYADAVLKTVYNQ